MCLCAKCRLMTFILCAGLCACGPARKVESVRTDYYELEGKVIYPSQVKVYKFNEE